MLAQQPVCGSHSVSYTTQSELYQVFRARGPIGDSTCTCTWYFVNISCTRKSVGLTGQHDFARHSAFVYEEWLIQALVQPMEDRTLAWDVSWLHWCVGQRMVGAFQTSKELSTVAACRALTQDFRMIFSGCTLAQCQVIHRICGDACTHHASLSTDASSSK